MRYCKILSAIALFAATAVLPAAPTPSPCPQTSPSPTPAAPLPVKDKKSDKDDDNLDFPVPKGMPIRGLVVPHCDENGKPVMTLHADLANRIEDRLIKLENAKIDAFDDDGKKIYIELPVSVFNLDTRILKGSSHALIRREDFEINGDSLEFNMKTKQGTMRGNITMIIQSEKIQ